MVIFRTAQSVCVWGSFLMSNCRLLRAANEEFSVLIIDVCQVSLSTGDVRRIQFPTTTDYIVGEFSVWK